MKKLILATILIFGFSISYGSETVKGAKKDYEQFKAEMAKELQAAEVKIDELKAKAKAKGTDTQDKTIKELEQTRDELKVKIEEMQKTGESGWKKFKKNIAASVDKLNKKIQKSLED